MVMGVSSWMVRNILSTRGTRGSSGTEKSVKLDLSKGIGENIREILVNVSKKHGISESHQISYLNAFVKLINDSDKEWPIPTEDILLCLRPALVNESNYVRAAALRVVKYLIRTKQDFNACIRLKYPCLLVRSLDLLLDNDCERTQALRVVRRLLLFNAQEFPIGLARCLVSLAMTPLDIRDRLLRATIGTLIELCILNPEVFIASGGVKALTRALCNAGHTSSPRIGETIVGALLFLVNRPETRIKAMISFDCLAAPYTDPHTLARHPEINTSTESQLQWAHYVIVSLLRSWPGVLHFCHPDKDGLRSIVNTLYLNQREIRKAVLDLLYDLLCLAQPEWSDEISVALDAVDPSRYQESFKLSDGFVAAEGKMVLPHISKSRVNLVEVHLSLLLYCFLEVGLLDAIVEVIVSDDTFLSVRATILLGELLHLIHLLLPPECCHLTPAIPNLLSYAVRGRPATSSTCTEKLYPESTQFGQHLSTKQPHMNDRPKSKENTVSGVNVNRPRGRVRTLSGQSGRSRTFSDDSSGDRSRREPPSELCDILVKGESSMDIVNESSASDKIAFSKVPSEAIVEGSTEADGYRCIPDYDPFVDNQLPLLNIPDHLRASPNPFVDCDITINDLGPTHSVDPPYSSRAQQRALTAVSALSQLHRMLRKRPAPASIFLDHFIMCIDHKEPLNCYDIARTKGKTSTNKNKLTQLLTKECEEAIKESGVLNVKDPFIWNWDTIRATLKSKSPCLYESSQRQFLRKLVHFFLPKSRNLLRVDVGIDRRAANIYTLTALELIDCLLLSPEDSECEKLLNELLTGISEEVTALLSSKSAHDCMFSPQNVLNTLCGDYFFHLGHMTRTRAGRKALDRFGLTQQFLDLVTHTNHECYVKIIVSVLDYSEDSMTRKIFNVALSSNNLSCRLYCTKLLHVLLRSPLHNNLEMVDWVVDLLVNQLYDEDRAVVNCAISALDEACDSKEYIEAIVKLRPSLLHLGDSGLLLLIRFLSTQEGFKYLNDANFVSTQLERWATHYNFKYVCLVESQLCDSLTLHQRGEDGRHCGRVSSTKHTPTDLFLPPHLYGQLTQHEAGFSALKTDENVQKLIKTVILGRCNTEEEILHLKAALWALGHISGSPEGARWARNKRVTAAMVHVVRYCQVYSVRATAFYALNITAMTAEGASTLRSVGWHTVRHHRHEKWPVVGSLDVLEDVSSTLIYDTNNYEKDSESNQSQQGLGYDLNVMDQIGKSGIFYLPKEPSVTSSDNDDFFNLLHFSGRRTRSSSGGGDSKTVRGRSATLPHYSSGSGATAGDYRINPSTFHHFRSASESKASDPNAEDVMSHYYDFATNTSADLNDLTELNNDDDAYYDDDSSISVKKTVEKKKPSVAGGSSGSNNSVASTSTNSNMSGTGLLNDSIVESGGISGSSSKLHGSVVISDRVQTLSPIPSAGSQATSVTGLKGRNVVAVVGQGQSHGRKSAFSVTNSGSTSRRQSISRLLSHQDAMGYATLKSLHRGRRPLPAPAPALSPLSPIELITFQDLRQMSPLVRPRHSENKPLMSEFEAHGVKLNHFLLEVGQPPTLPYQSSRSNIACTPTDDPSPDDKNAWNGSRYIGICLPQRLAELFPNDDEPNSVARLTAALVAMASKDVSRTSVTYDTSVTGTGAENISSAESETDTGTYTGGRGGGGTTTSGIGSGVDLEPPIKRRHNRSECLLCSVNGRTSNQKMTRWRKVSVSSAHRTRTETESSYGGGGIGESPIMLPWQPKGGLEGVNSVDSSSTDVTTSIAQRSVSDNLRSHSLVRRDLLKLVEQLSNPVLYKTCKQALLHLKQIYGDVFRDICVYCDVYTLISSTYHRIQSRRFLQELFLDVPFTELYEESAAALMSGGGESGEEFDEEFNVTTTGVIVNEQSTVNNNDNESSTSSTTSSNSSCSVNNDYDNSTNIDEVATNNSNVATNSNGSSKTNFPTIKLSSSSSGSVPSGITLNSATGNQQLSSLLVLEAIPESDARSDSSELSFNKMDSFLSDIKSTSITTDRNLQKFTSITSQQKCNENNDTEKAKELIKITSDKITELQSSLKLPTDKKISEPEDDSNKKTIKSSNPVISNTSAVSNKNSTSKDSKKSINTSKNQSVGDKTNKSNNDSVNKKDVVGESSTTVMNKRQRKRATTKEPNRESLEMARPSLRKK